MAKKKFTKKGVQSEISETSFGVMPDVTLSKSRARAKRKIDSMLKNVHTKGSVKNMIRSFEDNDYGK